ncbi:GNAT family N-acetyltransferase [Sphingomonas sp. S6]|jgi:ribosomal protein S18 acetylase RimI-like enzyme|uniref:GNAT family N-acetyltransferase n=1 Tax=Sphingomonas sp. S6 TaxID=3368600 RepID=UPI000F939BB6|nr:GNAT family N-acetyltransferase [uncultured Sphingomonas sp.]RTL18194.1 MAG: GNAT family N-acetyltransferase [Sphingomonadaceae bacterium]
MTDWRLRRASVEDAPAVALVACASFLTTFAGILDGADIVAHVAKNSAPTTFAAWVGDPDSVVTLAEHRTGAAPVGYSVLTTPNLPVDTDSGDIELRRIYTLPGAQGTGLGHALMHQAITDALAMGRTRLLLGVLGRNARARAFYERQGFDVVGQRQYRVGSALCDDVIYARPL